jgi:hypothetical protein
LLPEPPRRRTQTDDDREKETAKPMSDDLPTTAAGGFFEATVPLTPSYPNPYVTVNPTEVTVSIPLLPGERTTTTPEQVVGILTNFANPNLIGTLTVWSEYEPLTNTLTFCSNDLVDSDSTYLSTYMQGGQEQTCRQHTYLSDTTPCGSNENWNYCSGLTPGLMQAFQNTVREANQGIIDQAIAQGFTVIVRSPAPQVTDEEASKLLIAYENEVFKEVFDPEKGYGENITVQGIESTWYGEIYLNLTDFFANVIGSTSDPKIAGKSWLGLWEGQFGGASSCSSFKFQGFPCGSYLVGGHVILGKTATEVTSGSNSVFIMPICAGHNANNSIYMAPISYTKGIAIHNYMK